MKTRDQAIISITPAADHTDKEGYFVVISAGKAAVTTSATVVPAGVIIDGSVAAGQDSVALMNFGGTVRVKAAGAVTAGDLLQIRTDGAVETDDASGARTLVARALEDGIATELVDAALIGPIVYTA
jgi:hypothetical protein